MPRYANLDPSHRPQTGRAILRWGVWDPLLGRRRKAPPGPPAPRVEPDLDLIRERTPRPRLTWLGHAGFLGSLGGRAFVVDPLVSRRVGWVYRNHLRPPLPLERLPQLTCVLVSHNHYDHLDAAALARIPASVPAVVPRGLGAWFRGRRRRPVVELGWWESSSFDGLDVTLVPSRHWSRRRVLDVNHAHWGGFVVAAGDEAVYHAGDSAWFDGFAEIGSRFPGLLAAMLPVGGYEPGWFMENNHLTPEQAGGAFLDVGAARMIPMHWGAVQLTDEPLCGPIERLRAWWEREGPRDGRRLWVPAAGETLVLEPAGLALGSPGPGEEESHRALVREPR